MRTTLNGFVVSDDDAWLYDFFGYGCFSPKDVRDALEHNPRGEDLVLEINSVGGSVFAGFEMYSTLRSAAGVHTVAEVQSLAASAASTVMLGCERVLLSPVAQVMIHLPSTVTDGDIPEHRKSIKVLQGIAESILNAYELRCVGKTGRSALRAMMEKETWLTAQEAVDAGLADAILYADSAAPLSLDIVNTVGGGIRALAHTSRGMPDVNALRERYQALVDAGNAEPVETLEAPAHSLAGDWRNAARLSLEAKRFL